MNPVTKKPLFERMGRATGLTVTSRPWTTLLVGLVICLMTSFGLTKARFSTDYRIFFSHDDPGLAAFEHLENTFTKTDNVLFVVKTSERSIFEADGLAALQELTEAGWKLPYASRVDSLTNFQHPEAKNDDIQVGNLVPRPARELDAAGLAHVHAAAKSEPLLWGSLVSRNESTAAVNVTLRLPAKEPTEVSETADAARKLVDSVRARHPKLDIRASGMAFMNDAFMQASMRDLGVMMPLMVLVMLVGMVFVMRSVLATLAVAAIIGVSAAMSMAVAGWLHYPLTPPAVAAPMIVLTVAVADGVHIVLAAMEAMREGSTRAEAITRSLEKNLEAITYTWLTTIVGFVCLNYSDAPPVTHLANMTCFGVTAAFVYSFTVLPALFVLFPVKVKRAEKDAAYFADPAAAFAAPTAMERLAAFVVKRRMYLLVGTIAVTAVSAVEASKLETNDQFVKYFDESIPFRQDVEFTMKNLSGIYRLEFQVGSEGPSGIASPAYLEKLDAFGKWLRAQPEIEHVYSVADVIKRVNQVLANDDPAQYRIPDSQAAISEAFLVYEMGLPQGLDLTDRVNVDKSAARLTVTVKDISSKHMTELSQRAEGWLHANAPKAMWAEASGPVVIFSQLGDRNARSMVKGDFVSLAFISLCMIIVLRSVKLGILSVLPNVIPIVFGYGLWRLCVGQMNIVASVAGSISLGIIVDDTIHFLTRYKAMTKKGYAPEEAMTKTLVHTGPAMLGTAAILVLGFGVLTLSSFQMTSYLGWLSVIILAVAPLTDLVLAPALVLMFVKETAPEKLPKEAHPMKAIASYLLSLLTVGLVVTAASDANAKTADELTAAGTPEQKGQAVAAELAARNTGFKDLGGDVEMTLKDAGGGEAKRKFSLKLLEKPSPTTGDYSLIVFDAPADVKGTAVLSHAQVGDEDEQWLYLPSAHRTRRISSSNKTGSFAGSEFSFEDLTGNDGRKYDWKLTGTEACGSLQCLVVEATPKDPQSAYSKRILHIDKAEMRIQSIDFYDRKNTKLKVLAYDNYQKVNGRFWRSQAWTMKNLQSGKSTVITFSSMKIGNGYTVNDFATGKLGG